MTGSPEFAIAYRCETEGDTHEVRVDAEGMARPASAVNELGLQTVRRGATWRVWVCPSRDLRVTGVRSTLRFDLRSYDALYLNGYNSWTDSFERPVFDVMWGLTRCPRKIVNRYVLDGSGDYRFVPETPLPGHQHGFTYGYLRRGGEVTLFGSLDEDSGMTLVSEDALRGTITLEKEAPAMTLVAGEKHELMGFALLSGELRATVARWLSLASVSPRPARPIVGYTSWYRRYGDIDYEKLAHDLGVTAGVLSETDLEGADPVFQIDDGYARVGDWLDYDDVRFPEGLAPLAAQARSRGLLPGLWLAPFVAERSSRLFSEHRDWLARNPDGSLVTTGSNWSGAVALDVRKPAVRDYVRQVLGTVTREWGFSLLKLDFLYAACMVPHDGLNRGELMADALDLVRDAVPAETRLLLCGVPLASAFGRAEYCRIGCDVGLDWDDKPQMRLLHRERVSTKNSLANTIGRAHLDGLAFRCDPDVFFLREDTGLTAEQRERLLSADTTCGGVLLTSDDMKEWTKDQVSRYRRATAEFCRR